MQPCLPVPEQLPYPGYATGVNAFEWQWLILQLPVNVKKNYSTYFGRFTSPMRISQPSSSCSLLSSALVLKANPALGLENTSSFILK